jgi:hypothetical protein
VVESIAIDRGEFCGANRETILAVFLERGRLKRGLHRHELLQGESIMLADLIVASSVRPNYMGAEVRDSSFRGMLSLRFDARA